MFVTTYHELLPLYFKNINDNQVFYRSKGKKNHIFMLLVDLKILFFIRFLGLYSFTLRLEPAEKIGLALKHHMSNPKLYTIIEMNYSNTGKIIIKFSAHLDNTLSCTINKLSIIFWRFSHVFSFLHPNDKVVPFVIEAVFT